MVRFVDDSSLWIFAVHTGYVNVSEHCFLSYHSSAAFSILLIFISQTLKTLTPRTD